MTIVILNSYQITYIKGISVHLICIIVRRQWCIITLSRKVYLDTIRFYTKLNVNYYKFDPYSIVRF